MSPTQSPTTAKSAAKMAGKLAKKTPMNKLMKKMTKLFSSYFRPAVYYGLIPGVIYMGMQTEPKPRCARTHARHRRLTTSPLFSRPCSPRLLRSAASVVGSVFFVSRARTGRRRPTASGSSSRSFEACLALLRKSQPLF